MIENKAAAGAIVVPISDTTRILMRRDVSMSGNQPSAVISIWLQFQVMFDGEPTWRTLSASTSETYAPASFMIDEKEFDKFIEALKRGQNLITFK